MSADAFALLQRLERVKRTGSDHGVASCPTANHAHGDRHPSMTWRLRDDGALLIFCNAGCSAHEIVSAVGLDMSDLFPPRDDKHFAKGERRPFPAADLLRIIANEAQLVYLCARTVHAGEHLTDDDLSRLLVAVSRINSAMSAGGISYE